MFCVLGVDITDGARQVVSKNIARIGIDQANAKLQKYNIMVQEAR